MAAVCGICASASASSASSVPGTLARTSPIGESGGILAKSPGRRSGCTKRHGPSRLEEENQRPESRT